MKKRLDLLLVERNLVSSRQKANALIMDGRVFVDGTVVTKAGMPTESDADIKVNSRQQEYVSRGGLKLAKALAEFEIELEGMVTADIGASTGGFTDCMLQHNATRVYAVDVGYGQLAWKLRIDNRVTVLERTNARYLTAEHIPEQLDFATVDISFISLGLVLPSLVKLMKSDGSLICLIKPQFEAGKDKVKKNGVVREPEVHLEVIKKIYDIADILNLTVKGLTFSPVTGPKGNIEYLIYLSLDFTTSMTDIDPLLVVADAHKTLYKRT